MEKAILTPDEEREFNKGFRVLDRTDEFWERNAARIQQKYADQWVAFKGAKVVAHSRDAAELRRMLDRLGARAEPCIVRYVPRPDAEFAFGVK